MTTALRWFGAAVCVLGVGCQQDIPPPPSHEVAIEVLEPIPPPRIQPPPPRPPEVHPAVAVAPAHHQVSRPTRWFLSLSSNQRKNVKRVCKLRADDPCAGLLKPANEDRPDPVVALLADLTPDQRDGVDGYCGMVNRGKPGCNTPLVVAFEGQDVAFGAATPERFAFHAGEPSATDWPSAETPWIAIDRDGDGAITSGAELFGDATVMADGSTAPDGFAALAALDANGDGVLDARDPAFASLLLWAERNGDRTSSPDELRPLASVVTSIPLANKRSPRCTERGDCEGERGTVYWRDGGADRTGAVVDVYLRAR
jgi:hypothetical protein